MKYTKKTDVIAELKARGISYNPKDSLPELIGLLSRGGEAANFKLIDMKGADKKTKDAAESVQSGIYRNA